MTKQHADISGDWTLVCEQLTVARGRREVLHEIDLTVRAGECVALIGPNGSGKTTLMLAMLGLLPPTHGRCTLNGSDLRDLNDRMRGRFAAYVPQTIERIPAFSVYEVVASGRFPHVSPMRPLSAADQQTIDTALATCGLTELAERRIDAVSGGERQKALIAAAIAQDAQVMFLDEPNTALDPAYQLDLVRILRDWHASGRSLVLISHDLQLPAVLGGRVVALREGKIVADGDAADVLQPERLSEIYGAAFECVTTASGRQIALPAWWDDDHATTR